MSSPGILSFPVYGFRLTTTVLFMCKPFSTIPQYTTQWGKKYRLSYFSIVAHVHGRHWTLLTSKYSSTTNHTSMSRGNDVNVQRIDELLNMQQREAPTTTVQYTYRTNSCPGFVHPPLFSVMDDCRVPRKLNFFDFVELL